MLAKLALVAIFAAGGCKRHAAEASGGPPPKLEAPARADSERAKDDLWRRAGEGDPVDWARLADREGARGLLDGLDEGGPIAQAALLALPFAEDAEDAYQRIGEIIRQLDPEKAAPFVEAALAMANAPRQQVERLDPPGVRSCADALLELSRRTSAPAAVRAQAISALRLLVEQNAADAAAIPTDLDPR